MAWYVAVHRFHITHRLLGSQSSRTSSCRLYWDERVNICIGMKELLCVHLDERNNDCVFLFLLEMSFVPYLQCLCMPVKKDVVKFYILSIFKNV